MPGPPAPQVLAALLAITGVETRECAPNDAGCPHAFDLLVSDFAVPQWVIAHRVRYLAVL